MLSLIPNIACFPSSHCVGASVIKNWEPFVFGPEFAMDNIPAPKSLNSYNVRYPCIYMPVQTTNFFSFLG